MSLIIDAMRRGEGGLAQLLIQHTSPQDLGDYVQGQTALHIAVQKNYLEIVTLLLQYGAPINALASDPSYRKMTALHYAALTGNSAAVKLLLLFDADPHIKNSQHHTAATLAHQHGFEQTAYLIEKHMHYFFKINFKDQTYFSNSSHKQENNDSTKIIDFLSYLKNHPRGNHSR